MIREQTPSDASITITCLVEQCHICSPLIVAQDPPHHHHHHSPPPPPSKFPFFSYQRYKLKGQSGNTHCCLVQQASRGFLTRRLPLERCSRLREPSPGCKCMAARPDSTTQIRSMWWGSLRSLSLHLSLHQLRSYLHMLPMHTHPRAYAARRVMALHISREIAPISVHVSARTKGSDTQNTILSFF